MSNRDNSIDNYYTLCSALSIVALWFFCAKWLMDYGNLLSQRSEKTFLAALVIISYFLLVIDTFDSIPPFPLYILYLVAPYSFFFILDFFRYWKIPHFLLIAVDLILLLLAFVYVMCRRIKCRNRRYRIRIIIKRLSFFFRLASFLNVVCGLVLFIAFLVMRSSSFQTTQIVQGESAEKKVSTDFSIYKEENWSRLSVDERINALSEIIMIECADNGIPEGFCITISTEHLDENTLACYSDYGSYGEIRISPSHLTNDTALSVIRSVVHECEHCYQYRLCESLENIEEQYKGLRIIQKVLAYSEEFEEYKSVSHGAEYIDYFRQSCEKDARTRAFNRIVNYYLPQINEDLE